MYQTYLLKNESAKDLLLYTATSLVVSQIGTIYHYCINHCSASASFLAYVLVHHLFDVNELTCLKHFFVYSLLFVALWVLPFFSSALPLCFLFATNIAIDRHHSATYAVHTDNWLEFLAATVELEKCKNEVKSLTLKLVGGDVLPCCSAGIPCLSSGGPCCSAGVVSRPAGVDVAVGNDLSSLPVASGIDVAVGVDAVEHTVNNTTTIIDDITTRLSVPAVSSCDATTITAIMPSPSSAVGVSVDAAAITSLSPVGVIVDATTITSSSPVGVSTFENPPLAGFCFFGSRCPVFCDVCRKIHVRGCCRGSHSCKKYSPVLRPSLVVLASLRKKRQHRLVKRVEESFVVFAGSSGNFLDACVSGTGPPGADVSGAKSPGAIVDLAVFDGVVEDPLASGAFVWDPSFAGAEVADVVVDFAFGGDVVCAGLSSEGLGAGAGDGTVESTPAVTGISAGDVFGGVSAPMVQFHPGSFESSSSSGAGHSRRQRGAKSGRRKTLPVCGSPSEAASSSNIITEDAALAAELANFLLQPWEEEGDLSAIVALASNSNNGGIGEVVPLPPPVQQKENVISESMWEEFERDIRETEEEMLYGKRPF